VCGLPDNCRSSAKIKAIFQRTVAQRQRDEVTRAVRCVAVVQDETVWIGGFEHELDVGERQQSST